jgi:hypothetical protein
MIPKILDLDLEVVPPIPAILGRSLTVILGRRHILICGALIVVCSRRFFISGVLFRFSALTDLLRTRRFLLCGALIVVIGMAACTGTVKGRRFLILIDRIIPARILVGNMGFFTIRFRGMLVVQILDLGREAVADGVQVGQHSHGARGKMLEVA